MTGRSRKLGTAAVAVLAALAFGGAASQASRATEVTEDHYNPAGTQVTGTSHSTIFTVLNALTVTCTNSTAGGKTPATGLGKFPLSPLPAFNDGSPSQPCTDNFGGTDTTVTKGAWKLGMIDQASDETGTEPNSGDKLKVIVPIAGAVVTEAPFGCKITVAPTAPFTVIGTYDDVSTFTVNITNLPIKVVGGGACPTSATMSSFKGTYTFSPGVTDGS